ncbi:hypothetical protein N665_0201s0115 [Sinapis alba]|nr:hypothetical protein N665_0201s0115 [Sinapis alba]
MPVDRDCLEATKWVLEYTVTAASLRYFLILYTLSSHYNENDDLWVICADGGSLLRCDNYPRAFHIGGVDHADQLSKNMDDETNGCVLCSGSDFCRLGTALVDMYAKSGGLEEYARFVFERMCDKNVWTWSAMIVGLAQNGFAEEALRLELSAAGRVSS